MTDTQLAQCSWPQGATHCTEHCRQVPLVLLRTSSRALLDGCPGQSLPLRSINGVLLFLGYACTCVQFLSFHLSSVSESLLVGGFPLRRETPTDFVPTPWAPSPWALSYPQAPRTSHTQPSSASPLPQWHAPAARRKAPQTATGRCTAPTPRWRRNRHPPSACRACGQSPDSGGNREAHRGMSR